MSSTQASPNIAGTRIEKITLTLSVAIFLLFTLASHVQSAELLYIRPISKCPDAQTGHLLRAQYVLQEKHQK